MVLLAKRTLARAADKCIKHFHDSFKCFQSFTGKCKFLNYSYKTRFVTFLSVFLTSAYG